MGHHGWAHHMGGWGGDFGFGWVFPALIVGKILGEAFERPQAQPWGGNQPWPPMPQTPPAPQPRPQPQPQSQARPATSPAMASSRCGNCGGAVSANFAFCPHCGRRLEPPACRYCGQALDPKVNYCTHCGGPVAPKR